MNIPRRVIVSGGGTGGHIFPAIAIANALKALEPQTTILFVGANGRMEMDKVPAAGYKIVGLDIQGISRTSIIKNLQLPFKLYKSLRRAKGIINDFKPHLVIGVGGYASGPMLIAAAQKGIPYLIQEQNSYAGLTNKRLGKKAALICVAFEGMERFFPAEKILVTGNPIRNDAVDIHGKDFEAKELFGLSQSKKTVLITGGSLGARTLNNSVITALDKLRQSDIQIIWQCGERYYQEMIAQNEDLKLKRDVFVKPFLHRMDLAYAAADVIVARAGAGTIAELASVGKPVILVPSPNVAADHQTKNAMALTEKLAAKLVTDAEAEEILIDELIALLNNKAQMLSLSKNIKQFLKPDADQIIAKQALKLAYSS